MKNTERSIIEVSKSFASLTQILGKHKCATCGTHCVGIFPGNPSIVKAFKTGDALFVTDCEDYKERKDSIDYPICYRERTEEEVLERYASQTYSITHPTVRRLF